MAIDAFMWVKECAAAVQGTVLIKNAEELEGYSRSEEDRLEALIKSIADSGARVPASFRSSVFISAHLNEFLLQQPLLQDEIRRHDWTQHWGLAWPLRTNSQVECMQVLHHCMSRSKQLLHKCPAIRGRWWRPAAQSVTWRCTSLRSTA